MGSNTSMLTTPKQHQAEAIHASLSTLTRHDRAMVLMPCGTGKTLVGAGVAQQIHISHKTSVTVILVPTLALIEQTLARWKYERAIPNSSYLAVCSADAIVAEDDTNIDSLSREVDITTNIAKIARLAGTASPKSPLTIFGTYASSDVLGAALIESGVQADLTVFDEAHRTATGEATKFSTALRDEEFPSKRRLFMTATPRIWSTRTKDDPEESMDNERLYGKLAYQLSVKEAIKQGLICDYKILVSVVTKADLLDTSRTLSEPYKAANAFAIARAMEQYGLKKGILFHRNLSEAYNERSRLRLSELTGAHIECIDGSIPMAQRHVIMGRFSLAPVSLINNVKCLTEGVDVPSVDLVAFLSPKKSTVDVVQAAGRAMRLSPGKDVGYVLLPIFLQEEQGETIEEAVSRSKMSEVFRVLAEMREMETPIRANSRKGVASDDAINQAREYLSERMILDVSPATLAAHPESIDVVHSIRHAIEVVTVDDIRSAWEEKFLIAKAFMAENGHLLFDHGTKEVKLLGRFVSGCRTQHKDGSLASWKVDVLNSINFPWTRAQATWQRNCADIKRLAREKWSVNLQLFVTEQLKLFDEGNLSTSAMADLTAAGIDFVAHKQAKEQRLDEFSPRQAFFRWMDECHKAVEFRSKTAPISHLFEAAYVAVCARIVVIHTLWMEGAAMDATRYTRVAPPACKNVTAKLRRDLDIMKAGFPAIAKTTPDSEWRKIQFAIGMDPLQLSRLRLHRILEAISPASFNALKEKASKGDCLVVVPPTSPLFDLMSWVLPQAMRHICRHEHIAQRISGGLPQDCAKALAALKIEIMNDNYQMIWTQDQARRMLGRASRHVTREASSAVAAP